MKLNDNKVQIRYNLRTPKVRTFSKQDLLESLIKGFVGMVRVNFPEQGKNGLVKQIISAWHSHETRQQGDHVKMTKVNEIKGKTLLDKRFKLMQEIAKIEAEIDEMENGKF
jgi:hypothetical protein